MEYEINDDPQGLPDRPDGDRNGGLPEDRMFFRKDRPAEQANKHDHWHNEHSPLRQFGEAA